MTKPEKKTRHQWNIAGLPAVLLEDVVGHGGEVFKKGTRMRVNSTPIWDDEDDFSLTALNKPKYLPEGPWRGASGVKRRQFEIRTRVPK